MITIYDIKPQFQRLLRPLVNRLAISGVTANQVTLFTCAFCLCYAIFLSLFITVPGCLIFLPLILLLRMAFNAIDGLLAKEHAQKTPLGAMLNELTDMICDAALFLPFALYPGIQSILVVFIVIASLLCEAAGLCGVLIGASRRYDGPMGKSDRAFWLSLLALWLAINPTTVGLNWFLSSLLCLIIVTIGNRVYQSLHELRAGDGA